MWGVCSVLWEHLSWLGQPQSAAAEEKTDTSSDSVAAIATASEAPATSTATSAASLKQLATAATTYEGLSCELNRSFNLGRSK